VIETKNLSLIPHVPAHLLALMKNEAAYEKLSGMRVAEGARREREWRFLHRLTIGFSVPGCGRAPTFAVERSPTRV